MDSCTEIYNKATDWLSATFTYENCDTVLGNYAEKINESVEGLFHAIDPVALADINATKIFKNEFVEGKLSDAPLCKRQIATITAIASYIFFICWLHPSASLFLSVMTLSVGAAAYGTVSRAWEQAEAEIAARPRPPASTARDDSEDRELAEALRLSLETVEGGGGAPAED